MKRHHPKTLPILILYQYIISFLVQSHSIAIFFFLIYVFVYSQELKAQTPGLSGINVVINRISTEQGLSHSLVNAITQDKQGFIWIGTSDGLDRFDGQNFIIYTNDPDDSTSLSDNIIYSIFEDRKGILWVGTQYGLNKFNPTNKTFKRYFNNPKDYKSLSNNYIRCIFEDRAGVLWVGTAWGLNKFERTTETWTSYLPTPNDSTRPGDNFVSAILEDHQGNFWIGTGKFLMNGGGLHKFDRKKGTFSHHWHNPSDPNSLSGNCVTSLLEDGSGNLWVTVEGGYINILDTFSETFKHLRLSFSESDKLEHPVGNYNCICEDNKGALWISTWGMGLFRYDRRTGTFNRYTLDYSNPNSLSSSAINTLFIDKSGLLWVGTDRGGVNTIATKPFLNQHTLGNSLHISSRVDRLFSDKQGGLWISAIGIGLWRFDPRTQKSTHILLNGLSNEIYRKTEGEIFFTNTDNTDIVDIVKYDPIKNISTIIWSIPVQQGSRDWISSFLFDHEGILWVGTNGGSLYRIKANMKEYTVYVHDPQNNRSITGGHVYTILEDRSGSIWVGTAEGLNRFDKENQSFIRFIHNEKDSSSLSNNYWCTLFEDKSGTLWVGTLDGLNRFNKNNSTFSRFIPTDHHSVDKILEDGRGRLWYASGQRKKGISMFDPATGSFRTFSQPDGLENVDILGWSLTKLKSGEFLFGTANGILVFHPDSVKPLQYVPPIVISGLKKSNQPINLAASPELVREITLEHEDNVFSIEFAALSYDMPGFNQYAYMLEGFENDWVYCGNRREATYTNLNPGVYTFRVKGSNYDGVWNETGASITIIINPPWWKTWWAYLSYGVLFIFTLYGLRRYELNRVQLKDKIKMDEVVLKEREETDKIKSRFFANISHEFRTPLTLILGPAEKIILDTSDDIKKDANIIKRNSRRLLQLINQLLDLSRLEAGKLKLEASKGNIVSFVKGVALSFESLAESKDITLKLQPEKDFIELYFDREKMMKILTNILSNAFKFTSGGGMITVSIKPSSFPPLAKPTSSAGKEELKGGSVEIKIRDTGIGIPQEEIPKLFDRFYQVDSSFTKEHEGTGIGLALTKELVELHHGNINVESKIGDSDNPPKVDGINWTEFMVTLPVGSYHLKDDEIIKTEKTEASIIPVEQEAHTSLLSKTAADSIAISINDGVIKDQLEEKTIILVVEDNYDMREYIKESLDESYRVEEAVNGEQGVRKAEKIIPDLIISDMMMPKMDGNELVRILKNDEKTSHIPIILLTAKAGYKDKLEGLETGADDYLTKPFDIKELQVRIKNLISIRKKLQEKFSKIEYRTPKTDWKKLNSIDEKFMLKVTEVVEKHISKEEFSIEDFGNEVGMSRMQIHRKLKALTGKSASHYIRSFRLERAKEILSERNENISEIAYSLGFGSPAYFTRCFKEEFGYPPSELKN